MTQVNSPAKQEQTHRPREHTCGGHGGGGGMDWEFGISRCKRLLHREWMNNQVLL